MDVEVHEVEGYEELERWVAVRNAISREDAKNVHMMSFLRAHELERVDLNAYVDREPAATGFLAGDPHSTSTTHPFFEFGVLEPYRCRGVGTAIVGEISRRARSLGKVGLTAETHAVDDATISYLTKRGFAEIDRWRRLSLDLATLNEQAPSPPGLEIVRLSDRPELMGGMYEIAALVYPQLSGYVAAQAATLTEWQTYELANPAAVLDLAVVGLDGGVVDGFATALAVDEGTLFTRMVAVRPDRVGRGIGRALLLTQAHRAREAGYTCLDVSRRAAGEPGLHADLGLALTTEFVALQGPLLL